MPSSTFRNKDTWTTYVMVYFVLTSAVLISCLALWGLIYYCTSNNSGKYSLHCYYCQCSNGLVLRCKIMTDSSKISLAAAILKIPIIALVMVRETRVICAVLFTFSHFCNFVWMSRTPMPYLRSQYKLYRMHSELCLQYPWLVKPFWLRRVVSCSTPVLRLAFVHCIPCFYAFSIYT